MLPSALTAVFFAVSVVFAARSTRILGPGLANLIRLTAAAALLALWAHLFGIGLRGESLPWFLVSGVIGFGFGDLALFAALSRVGPRLAILLTQCLAAPIAAFLEWAWLGTGLRFGQGACATLILVGVALALAPDRGWVGSRRLFWTGALFGLGSALGQASGAVLSRKANAVALLAGFSIDGGSAAYQRILGGLTVSFTAVLVTRSLRLNPAPPAPQSRRQGWIYAFGHALTGPTLGVACYQWALQTTPSGVVLPIVATSPLITMLLAWAADGQRPARRAIVGGVVAVCGAVALSLVRF